MSDECHNNANHCPLCSEGVPRFLCTCGQDVAVYRCPSCGVEVAHYPVTGGSLSTDNPDHFRALDLQKYERSVRATREEGYIYLLHKLSERVSRGRWLDVGCSYGWLLRRVQAFGFAGFGVEPSPSAVAVALRDGLNVVCGAFPESAGTGAPYSVISFIDVLEHLVDPVNVIGKAGDLLEPGGVLVIQVPDQACLLYQLAKSLCRVSRGRFAFAWERLWLTRIDFPHRYYFSKRALLRLLDRCSLDPLDCYRTSISNPRQAVDRITYLSPSNSMSKWCVVGAVATINCIDAQIGCGGLLTVIARKRPAGKSVVCQRA
jgi:SAM-dependent methyltransferase